MQTYIQVSESSYPCAGVAAILCHEVHHLAVDEGVGDGGQVAVGEMVLAVELDTKDRFVKYNEEESNFCLWLGSIKTHTVQKSAGDINLSIMPYC